jgi:hypothetical protein
VNGRWEKIGRRLRALLGGRELRCVCGIALWETAVLVNGTAERKKGRSKTKWLGAALRGGLQGGRKVDELVG